MWPSLSTSVPLLYIDNIYDYYKDFLDRYVGPNEAKDSFQNLCARFMFFGGIPKLIVCQKSVVVYDYLREHLGLEGDIFVIPDGAVGSTIEKIIRSPETLEKIVAFSEPQKKLQIIGWAGTLEIWNFAQYLEKKFGITVILPETSSSENLWIQKYLDTKRGFREVVSTTFCPEEKALPEGFVCSNEHEMFEAIRWFSYRNTDCIVKPDQGIEGRGILAFESKLPFKEDDIKVVFDAQKNFFNEEPIIVEKKIRSRSDHILSPSAEYYIPPNSMGDPIFTYLVNQVFHEDVCFVGAIISKKQYSTSWCASLLKKGDRLARKVQNLGYVGYMDIDCIVDENNNVYLVEINPRRTGSTHIHEIAVQLFGENYIQEIALISNSHFKVSGIDSFEQLYDKAIDLLYVPHQDKQGIIITNANLLSSYGTIGVLSIGKDENEAANCLSEFQARVCPTAV
ncbi:MAG: hypothetical protein QNJ46_02355 [Leptolyngbyaceae cyanobacterium MO_188.B28]|nr:hypothetical protein [Leptolyngbyaceae cyanobacterium MO_188.B28]